MCIRDRKKHITLLICKTIIGKGEPEREGTAKAHGEPLGVDGIQRMRQELNWDFLPFEVSEELKKEWDCSDYGHSLEGGWQNLLEKSPHNAPWITPIREQIMEVAWLAGKNRYEPLTLDEHWNSEHMKSVRRRMMAGEELPECKVCNNQLLNADVYRNWFNTMYKRYESDIWLHTDPDGTTSMKPISFDYRFSNLCNFKCRMCGPMLSSSAETEAKKMNSWDPGNDPWMVPPVRDMISE